MTTSLLLWFSFAVLLISRSHASFYRDVLAPPRNVMRVESLEDAFQEELLTKSVPWNAHRHLQGEGEDDFYVDYSEMYSFSSYSMKYVKCQPVQYFSEDALAAGEHSPMITQDIVMLRLCPAKSCTASQQYGCHYNYAEYAIGMADYLTILLKYRAKRRDSLCAYCAACGVVYQGNSEEDAANNGGRRLEDGAAAGDDVAAAVDDAAAAEDANNAAEQQQATEAANDCTNVDSYCHDYDNECGSGEDGDPDGYLMSYEDYLDYLTCTEVRYNDHSYFVRPRCDGYKGTIKMDVFYDTYCVQYAGNDVSIKSLGMGFREGIFTEFYNGTCLDCTKTDAAPFYNTNSALCNKVHATSAKCTSDLLYNLFDGEENDATECSYIESIRFGTYDEVGKLSSATNGVTWTSAEVSNSQKVLLSLSVALCVAFIVYSCYLHHSMTNLLIKSLSHRELLPPSRHQRPGRNKQAPLLTKEDMDWEQHQPGIV
jgi:hypothetical protein